MTSYAIFNYECGSLQWAGLGANLAVSGYNLQAFSFEQDFTSGLPQISEIACRNSPCSEFYTVLYDIGGVTADFQLALANCVRLAAEDEQNFLALPFSLADCPCSLFQAVRDSRYLLG